MPDRRTFLSGLTAAAMGETSSARAQASYDPVRGETLLPLAFSWTGPLIGATRALASQLGYTAWANMASGLPIPQPPPVVNVSVGFASATPVVIVVALEAQADNRAVVILDPRQRTIGVVYND